MFWKIFFLSLSLIPNLFASPVDEMYLYNTEPAISEEKPLFVSLGHTCHVAIALRALGFREAAYPFDWIITANYKAVLHVLEDDFAHFTDPHSFTQHIGIPQSTNTYYQLSFPHDFKAIGEYFDFDKAKAEWLSFLERYSRRVERFRQLKDYKGKVYFVRAMWGDKSEGDEGAFNENTLRAQEMRDALKKYFPHLDFTLVIISHPDLEIPEIQGVEDVVELKVNRGHEDFYNKMMDLAFPLISQGSTSPGGEQVSEETHVPIKPRVPGVKEIYKLKATSAFKALYFKRGSKALYFGITFPRTSKTAIQSLKKAGFTIALNSKGRSYGFYETKDPKTQLLLLKFAKHKGAIPADLYLELERIIRSG